GLIGQGLPADFVRELFFSGLTHGPRGGIRACAHEKAHALDEVRQAGKNQQQKTHRYQQLGRPSDEAPGVGRLLVQYEGLVEERYGQPENQQAGRKQKEENAEDLDLDLSAARELLGQHEIGRASCRERVEMSAVEVN